MQPNGMDDTVARGLLKGLWWPQAPKLYRVTAAAPGKGDTLPRALQAAKTAAGQPDTRPQPLNDYLHPRAIQTEPSLSAREPSAKRSREIIISSGVHQEITKRLLS